MAEPMAVDVLDGAGAKGPDSQGDGASKGSLKRKRATFAVGASPEEKEAKIEALREELEGLFRYYREELERRVVEDGENLKICASMNSAVACLMEESSLPLTKLVDEIFAKIGDIASGGLKSSAESVSKTGVKSTVILIGQRMFYGIPGSDADVLEDESESALWCWETRDAKLLPKSVRSAIRIRRTCRKKIHERISAVSGMLAALYKPDSHQNSKELMKASEKFSKVLAEADIRSLIHNMGQTSGAEIAEKDTKKERILIKQMEKSIREAEKEKKRLEKELQKEKLQSEKEQKRLQHEAEKEERRREKEESELRKQLKKQQEEAEKDQRRKEKEEADLKKQQSLQKQASLMERFLKKNKSSSTPQGDPVLNSVTSDLSPDKSDKMPESVTPLMDSILSLKDVIHAEDLWRSHINSWRCLGHLIHSNRNAHWGLRRGPRTEVVKELKLTTNRGLTNDGELSEAKPVDGWVDTNRDIKACNVNPKSSPSGARNNFRSIKLLQFDKSHRPAFYGVWPKNSKTVRGRCPFTKDPELDYEFDSDEEWEEEEPGESLSDCDKDDIESLEEDCSRGDNEEEESEDGFFVPDGYLSEDEGVELEKNEPDSMAETKVTPSLKQEVQSEEVGVLRQEKYLNNFTEHALKKNQPLFILNFMHEKATLLLDDDVTGNEKVEQACLGALKMCSFPGYPSIQISYQMDERAVEASPSNSCKTSTPQVATSALQDSDLPQIVSAIKSYGQGLNKVVESLQHKFPHTSKTQIRSKVREIADFSDNRWQVKKDILTKLGISLTPEKVGSKRTMKSIAAFFSKRCLPPSSPTSNNNPHETSPQPNLKTHLGGELFRQESENKQE